jgi:hypothetical protein
MGGLRLACPDTMDMSEIGIRKSIVYVLKIEMIKSKRGFLR